MEKQQMIFGIRAILEAIRSGAEIDKVYLQQDASGDLMRTLVQNLKRGNIHCAYVPVEKLNKLTTKNHQGAVATIAPIGFHELEPLIEKITAQKEHPLLLLLDQISDARNFGAILRTAECTGVDAVIVPQSGSAPISGDTVKTSAGAVFNLPLSKVSHLKDAIFYLQGSGFRVVAATEKADNTLFGTDLTGPLAIVMGSEDRGINPSILKIVDAKAKLPLQGTIGSLNVSVACGAFLYEALRQRMV